MTNQTITTQDLIDAIRKSDGEMAPCDQGIYLDDDFPDCAIIDGRINLIRVAEILSGKD